VGLNHRLLGNARVVVVGLVLQRVREKIERKTTVRKREREKREEDHSEHGERESERERGQY
jgi:hypothetical protein